MNKVLKTTLIGSGIILLAVGGIIIIPKLIKGQPILPILPENSNNELDYDKELVKLLTAWGAMTQAERNAMVAGKLDTSELSRIFVLMSEFSKNRKDMSKFDKEELFRLLNRIFV